MGKHHITDTKKRDKVFPPSYKSKISLQKFDEMMEMKYKSETSLNAIYTLFSTPLWYRKSNNIQENFDQDDILLNAFIKHSYQPLDTYVFNREFCCIILEYRRDASKPVFRIGWSKTLIVSCKKIKLAENDIIDHWI